VGPAEVIAFWREAGPDKWFRKDADFDRAIAERIRNKLRHFGVPPRLQRERLSEALAILSRLLARGVASGGVPRTWHFLRSLPLTKPGLLHVAVNDWIAALAMRDYVERHLLERA